jgi:choice-of-anchor C domain-containing protein
MYAVRLRWVAVMAAGCTLATIGLAPGPQAVGASGFAANLLVNGSFEQGPEEVGDFLPLDKDSGALKGWVVTRGQIDLIGTHWQSAHGKRSLDLHGSPGFGGVAQSFKTQKGAKYRVTFFLAGNPDGTVAKKTMAVRAAGQQKEFSFDTTGRSNTDMGWQQQTWEFTAERGETTLELFTLMTEDENCGPAIDDVTMVAAE